MLSMQRRIAVLVGLVSIVMAAAPAAWATVVPFDVDVPLNEQTIRANVETNEDTGLVGACDSQYSCTGFRVTEATTPITGGTTRGHLRLAGYVCIRDMSAACTSNGVAFTGVKITDRTVDSPEAYIDPFAVHVNFCLWLMSPQNDPYACDLPELNGWNLYMEDSGNLTDYVPAQFWGAF